MFIITAYVFDFKAIESDIDEIEEHFNKHSRTTRDHLMLCSACDMLIKWLSINL